AIAPLLYGVEGGIFTYLQELNGTHSVPILAIIIVGIFSKRVSGKAANIAILFSVVTYLITLYVIKPDISFLHLMGILFVLTILIMFVVSKFVPRETDYVQEYTRQVDITSWKYLKPVGFTIVGLVVALYIYLS
ncbi:MAG: solute:sodium symporter family transporter, partial [Maribacter sp.]